MLEESAVPLAVFNHWRSFHDWTPQVDVDTDALGARRIQMMELGNPITSGSGRQPYRFPSRIKTFGSGDVFCDRFSSSKQTPSCDDAVPPLRALPIADRSPET